MANSMTTQDSKSQRRDLVARIERLNIAVTRMERQERAAKQMLDAMHRFTVETTGDDVAAETWRSQIVSARLAWHDAQSRMNEYVEQRTELTRELYRLDKATAWGNPSDPNSLDRAQRAQRAIERERPEFPTYVGWDGREHGEF